MRAVSVFFAMLLPLLSLACGSSQAPPPGPAPAAVEAVPPPAPAGDPLPPSEQDALARLEKSPRHGEYVDLKLPAGGTPIRTWVVYPERKSRAGVVIVIHEVYGLSDWIRAVADQLAQEGFIAVAPDLISGRGPGGGGTGSVTTRDEVVALVRGVTPNEATARLNAVHDYAVRLPAS
ncbi:MAG: dienelactone hydrolase family protein, partial [Acidobacteriota bacterium]